MDAESILHSSLEGTSTTAKCRGLRDAEKGWGMEDRAGTWQYARSQPHSPCGTEQLLAAHVCFVLFYGTSGDGSEPSRPIGVLSPFVL